MAKTKEPVDASAIVAQLPVAGGGSKKAPEEPKKETTAAAPRFMSSIKRGVELAPPRIVTYGPEGVGKSTFAAGAPQPIFIDAEDGLGRIDCHRFPRATSFGDVAAQLMELVETKHPYQTVAVDSLDWIERLIWEKVCLDRGKENIEDIGFQKGYTYALDSWRLMIGTLDRLRLERGMAVILIAHSKVEKFEDPETSTYDRYSPRLHKHAVALIHEWSDAVLFATRKFVLRKEGEGTSERKIAQPVGANGGERILKTTGSASCVAKNRYSLPAEMPLSWDAVMSGILEDQKRKGA